MVTHPCISICSGVGLLDRAVEMATAGAARPILHVEREAFSAANLVYQGQDGLMDEIPIWSDLFTATSKPVRDYIRARSGSQRLGGIIGGIPCQPWSDAGKKRGANDDRNLWPATLKLIEAFRPEFVFIENVAGILSKPMGGERIVRDLQTAGYGATAGLFSSAEMGANHERKRTFFLALDKRDGNGRQRRGGVDAQHDISDNQERLATEDQQQWSGWINRIGAASHDVEHAASRERNTGNNNTTTQPPDRNPNQPVAPMDDSPGFSMRQDGEDVGASNREINQIADSGGTVGDGPKEAMAYCDSEGKSQQKRNNGKCGGRFSDSSRELWYYAPAQNDWKSWELVAKLDPARMPVVESELCRVANGVAGRIDRIRSIGNGVDPLAAAVAFVVLFATLLDG